VDWADIRPTEEFMQAIYAAIEGSDTFIFVLTPDSVASVVCDREIAHARSQAKPCPIYGISASRRHRKIAAAMSGAAGRLRAASRHQSGNAVAPTLAERNPTGLIAGCF
jgi:hypothetical protein